MNDMTLTYEATAEGEPSPESSASTDLIQRVTVDELLGWRGRAMALAEEARLQYRAYLDKIKEAGEVARRASPTDAPFYKLGENIEYCGKDQAKFAEKVRQDIDRCMWGHLLTITGIEGLMDKQARDEFDRQLASEPPEITLDNIRATFEHFKTESHRIFRRGLVNVFRNLAREYRSHDGFKLGPRTIIDHGVGEYKEYNTFADADRIMHILDGVPVGAGWYSSLAAYLRRDVKTEWRSKGKHWTSGGETVIIPGELTTRYWRVKWFQNKNVHLWCLRPDLLRRANRLIAEHFEDALGEGPDAAGARRYQRARPHHHDVEDFYPTPALVVARMIEAAKLEPDHEVLEPSAGDGAIVKWLIKAGVNPDCVEIDPDRADILRDMLPPGAVVNMDFLKMHPEPEFDRILMNPPFGQGAGIAHVFHATKFLKPGGRLVAILGAGLEYRVDGPTIELRKLIEAWNGAIQDLPAGSFKESGTDVDVVMITMVKPQMALPAPSEPTLL